MEQQFVQLISQHQGIIHKVCAMYEDLEENRRDLFQEIVLQLWKAYPRFRGESKVTTWMYRVALNIAISHFRKRSRKVPNDRFSDSLLQIADEQYDYDYEEKVKVLREAIQSLNKVEKAIMMLYLEDKSYEEIAETVGITQNYVRVKMNRIKEKLKKNLAKK